MKSRSPAAAIRSARLVASIEKAIITCALTGILTDPKRYPVPVNPEEMAQEARRAFDAGASIMHVHFRQQETGKRHLPSWEPPVALEIIDAIRSVCPGVIINMSTGVVGPDVSPVIACLKAIRPEIAACNAGSLNYLKTRRSGEWAWPPILFDNPVEKIVRMLDAMAEVGASPEFECFDLGIIRSVGLYVQNDIVDSTPDYNFVCGVASGMPADSDLLPLLLKYRLPESPWQVTAIGRQEVWDLHRRAAELGGNLRTGLEDCFYLPNGNRAMSNGDMVEAMANLAGQVGRTIASPSEARELMNIA